MNSIPDCFASSSKEAIRSSAGMSIECVEASAALVVAGADHNAQQRNPARAHRFVEVLKIGDSPKDSAWRRFRTRLALGQNNAVAASFHVDREAALQKPKERVGVAGAEVAADANAGNGRVLDEDLPCAVAIEVGNRVGQRGVAEDDIAAAPTQELFDLCRCGLVDEDGRLQSPRFGT